MPWFPEFASAAELARHVSLTDVVGRYQAGLATGDTEAVVRTFRA